MSTRRTGWSHGHIAGCDASATRAGQVRLPSASAVPQWTGRAQDYAGERAIPQTRGLAMGNHSRIHVVIKRQWSFSLPREMSTAWDGNANAAAATAWWRRTHHT